MTADKQSAAPPVEREKFEAEDDPCRDAFEQYMGGKMPRKLLFKRGGTVFAEGLPHESYCDSGIQDRWIQWKAAWQSGAASPPIPAGQTLSAQPVATPSDADRKLMEQAVVALMWHQAQTRPITRTAEAIADLRSRLDGANAGEKS